MTQRTFARHGSVLMVAAALTACGGGSDGDAPASAPAPAATTTPPASTTRPAVVDVNLRRAFKQQVLALVAGTSSVEGCTVLTPATGNIPVPGGGPVVIDGTTGLASASIGSVDVFRTPSLGFGIARDYAEQTAGFSFRTRVGENEPTVEMRRRSDGTTTAIVSTGPAAVGCPGAFNSLPNLAVLTRQIFTASRVPMSNCTIGLTGSAAAADVTVNELTIAALGISADLGAPKLQEALSFRDDEGRSGALSYSATFADKTVNLRIDDSGYLRSLSILSSASATTVLCEKPAA
jgi:hypothetical protein